MGKSLLVSRTYFPPQVGGISHFMASVASALGPARVCCLTAVPRASGAEPAPFRPRVYRRPMAFTGSTGLQALGLATAVGEIVIRERPSVVQLAMASEGYLGLLMKRWMRLPFVIYAHGNEILEAMQSEWDKPRLALRSADRILANSRFTKELVHKIGVDPDRIDIVHPGCDSDRFRPHAPEPDLRRRLLGGHDGDRVVLTIGNLVARKGHDMVIRALPRLCRTIPNVTYLIVGDGPYRTNLEQLAAATGVADRVVFAGRIADRDLPRVYSLGDVFVMPSREQADLCDVEGFGLVFLEANACGKPVVGGRSGGVPDAIVEGQTGFLVDPHDVEEIAATLGRVLGNRELAHRLGQQGRERAVREFAWSRIGDHVQTIVESVCRAR